MTNSRVGLHIGLTSLTLVLLWRLIRRPKIRHPPSPTSIPFLGNIFSIPSGHEYIGFTKLGEQLESDVVYLEILGNKIIILNSAEAALDVLEKRSAFHSDRPSLPMVKDPTLMDWSGLPSVVGYNDLWRHYRRMMNIWLNARAVTQFDELQDRQARLLLQRLLSAINHSQPFEHVRNEFFFAMASSIFQLAYGYKIQDPQDQFFQNSQQAFHNVTVAGMQANFLVNIFPAMTYIPDWFPGTGWKRTAREWRAHQIKAKTEPYEWLKAQVANGTNQPSVLSSLLQDHKILSGLTPTERDERLKEIGISANFLVSFVAAMLDTIIGPAVLPSISDKERLPYLRNVIEEVLRLYPVVPLAHVIYITIRAIGRDPRHYENPEVFNPDRYLDPDVPRAPVFGWGRRKCPGIHFAETSMLITTALLLSVFTFSKRKDSSGKEIEPRIELETSAIMLALKPFDFEFMPRSEVHRKLILGAIND
ncbi:cytochrome P450 [Rhizoctonia solani]|nr:cytochrome P450 [Rhizoctonia solani]